VAGRRLQVLVAVVALLGVVACSDSEEGATGTDGTTTSNSTTAPAGPTATVAEGRAPAVRLGATVALERPSAVADPPGPGPILVSTLGGEVHEVDLATGATAGVLDLGDQISSGGERGLLGLAVDPAGQRLYANLTNRDGDTEVRSWALAGGRPQAGEGVLHLAIDQPYANHNGGHLVFGPDGALWVGTGDGGGAGDPEDRAQDPDDQLGKLLRVTPDPAGGGTVEVWAIGLRNPWRFSFDRGTNRLWVADVGQGEVEEVSVVDLQAARPDFGWDTVEGDQPFEGEPSPAFVPPVLTYGHDDGCSVTGGYVYRGTANPGLHGWYLYGDYCGGWVRAVPASDPGREPVELLSGVGSVLSFAELEDGELLLLTDGGVHRLVAP
jgi:glucose/arabinose dehydrogenase